MTTRYGKACLLRLTTLKTSRTSTRHGHDIPIPQPLHAAAPSGDGGKLTHNANDSATQADARPNQNYQTTREA